MARSSMSMAMASPWCLPGIPPGYLGRAWSFPKPAVFADHNKRPSREDSGDEKRGIRSEIIKKYGEYIIFWGFHGNTYYIYYIYIYVTNKIII